MSGPEMEVTIGVPGLCAISHDDAITEFIPGRYGHRIIQTHPHLTMLKFTPAIVFCAGLAGFLASQVSASAAGVSVGSSSLFAPAALDYSDTFTVGTPARPDGLYNDNTNGGYGVQNSYGNPAATWTPFSNFSFNTGAGSTCCGYPGNAGSAGSSASSGLAQSGGNDFSIAYGLDTHYLVQVDAVLPPDRLDIGSYAAPGNGIFTANSLSVFFRRQGAGNPEIGLYNGSLETNTGFLTGILSTDTSWHNFAVDFNLPANTVSFYVDEAMMGSLNLATFAGGAYQNYSNNAVGIGGTFVFWADNFQVAGLTVPEPGSALLAGLAGLGLLRRRRA